MRTLGMKVENIGFLIDRLGRDCAPDQYLRELTQNAIEAIIKSGRTDGRIVWDFVEQNGVRKLCICDNGIGMAGDELVRYINSLSSSGSIQGMDSNYGVGAKIAAATRNPEGLVYLSWQEGFGAGIQLVRDGSGQYGLLQFPDHRHVFDAEREMLPRQNDVIDGEGTCVILLGNEANEDTAVGPTAQWIRRYLNTRYFTIPRSISIQCRAVGKTDTGLRPVHGQKWMLTRPLFTKARSPFRQRLPTGGSCRTSSTVSRNQSPSKAASRSIRWRRSVLHISIAATLLWSGRTSCSTCRWETAVIIGCSNAAYFWASIVSSCTSSPPRGPSRRTPRELISS